jgi:hypothetical protein
VRERVVAERGVELETVALDVRLLVGKLGGLRREHRHRALELGEEVVADRRLQEEHVPQRGARADVAVVASAVLLVHDGRLQRGQVLLEEDERHVEVAIEGEGLEHVVVRLRVPGPEPAGEPGDDLVVVEPDGEPAAERADPDVVRLSEVAASRGRPPAPSPP